MAVLALAAFTSSPVAALADEAPIAAAAAESAAPQTVYFGNGCFWGRQKEFVDAEKTLGRAPDQVSAVVGYAGGKQQGAPPSPPHPHTPHHPRLRLPTWD